MVEFTVIELYMVGGGGVCECYFLDGTTKTIKWESVTSCFEICCKDIEKRWKYRDSSVDYKYNYNSFFDCPPPMKMF